MSDPQKQQMLGANSPKRPRPINECKTRLDSTVLANFSRQSLPNQKQPQQNKKNK